MTLKEFHRVWVTVYRNDMEVLSSGRRWRQLFNANRLFLNCRHQVLGIHRYEWPLFYGSFDKGVYKLRAWSLNSYRFR